MSWEVKKGMDLQIKKWEKAVRSILCKQIRTSLLHFGRLDVLGEQKKIYCNGQTAFKNNLLQLSKEKSVLLLFIQYL